MVCVCVCVGVCVCGVCAYVCGVRGVCGSAYGVCVCLHNVCVNQESRCCGKGKEHLVSSLVPRPRPAFHTASDEIKLEQGYLVSTVCA